MEATPHETGYGAVNGLEMYYEIHGDGPARPIVLLHGAFSAIGTSFGPLIPELAKNRRVIAVDFQGHGRTADIDRPLRVPLLASDVVALLGEIGVGQADFFGYSLGAGVAMEVAVTHPELVGKLVVASLGTKLDGFHPGLFDNLGGLRPDMLFGTPWHEEYMRVAPRPDDFATLVAKVTDMNVENARATGWPDDAIRGLTAPTLIIIGDSDIVRPEHAVEVFRLLGGGVAGDAAGMPKSQLAILPGTSHVTVVYRTELLLASIVPFLDAPVPGP